MSSNSHPKEKFINIYKYKNKKTAPIITTKSIICFFSVIAFCVIIALLIICLIKYFS